MKRKFSLIIVLLLTLLLVPGSVFGAAKSIKKSDYKSLNFIDTLADEELEQKFDSYKESKDAVTIYLFRGKGCGYCRAFLSFMNDITDEYGKYFKMESFEVWNDAKNSSLMQTISYFLEKPAGGVPYIIIGDKVFAGFSEEAYGDSIKQAIKDLYNTKKEDRYDVFEEYNKSIEPVSSKSNDTKLIICAIVIAVVATIINVVYVNTKFNSLSNEIQYMNDQNRKMMKSNKQDEEVVVRKKEIRRK